MSKASAVVFDLDDCLFLEIDYVFSGFRAVATWLAAQGHADAETTRTRLEELHHNGARGNTFDRLLTELRIEHLVSVGDLLEVYRDHTPTIRPCHDSSQVVPLLRERYPIGLISDGYLSVQAKKLNALGIREWFDAIVLSDEFGREHWKPDSRPYEEALTRLEAVPSKSVYVGDNPAKDFLGARRAGMKSIRIRRSEGIYSTLEPASSAHAPDCEIDDLNDLGSVLNTLLDDSI